MSIEVQDVKKYYGHQAALNGVNFSVKKGEVVGFLGPNGAGKSTMMKIITCYLPPSSGNVSVAGIDIYKDPLKIRKQVGYLPETNALYPEMYIREYLRYVAGLYHLPKKKEKVDEVIEQVGLQPEAHKQIGQLSKGYRQRVGLAQAIIHDPEVLILDEPTSGLDPNQLDDIRKLIKKLGKDKTVLVSTHIMQEVEAMCSRVIIIKSGKLVADSPVKELTDGNNRATIFLKVSAPLPIEQIKALAGVERVELVSNCMYRIVADGSKEINPALNQIARSQGVNVEELRREARNLESIFRNLTK